MFCVHQRHLPELEGFGRVRSDLDDIDERLPACHNREFQVSMDVTQVHHGSRWENGHTKPYRWIWDRVRTLDPESHGSSAILSSTAVMNNIQK